MKKVLFIFGLLLGLFLFAPEEGSDREEAFVAANREVVTKEKGDADVHHCLEVLSNELKSSNCLTPRRTVQTIHNHPGLRIQKGAERILHHFRQKGEEVRAKVVETHANNQTIHVSTLLCRMGQHLFALRKLII